jgi:hypothetical protein
LPALAVYGLLTLGIVVSLLLVMRSLGGRPILIRSAGLADGDWVTVTDADLRYTLSLPADWQWLDVAFRDQSALLDTLIDRQPYIARALRPLGEAAGDVAILAAAVGAQSLELPEPQPLLVVGRGESLDDLTPRAALESLTKQPLPISGGSIDTRLAGQSQARFETLDDAEGYRCRHLFVADDEAAGYLVAACAPRPRFAALEGDLQAILDSFQLLEP